MLNINFRLNEIITFSFLIKYFLNKDLIVYKNYIQNIDISRINKGKNYFAKQYNYFIYDNNFLGIINLLEYTQSRLKIGY